MTDIIKALNWRYATKKFDINRKVSEEDLNELLEAARLAPSSYGLQPWKFVVVTDPELRKKLREVSKQSKLTDASHLIVLSTRTDVDENYVKHYIEKIAEKHKIEVSSLQDSQNSMINDINRRTKKEVLEWNKRQTYIALGFLLFAAAQKNIDACPMEGFDPAKFDEILELKKHNLASTVLCAIGYRSADDPAAKLAKVRFDAKDVVLWK